MDTKSKKRTQLIGRTFVVFVTTIMTAYAFARRMPYLLNMHNMWTYFIFTLAAILVLSIYVVFLHQWKDPNLNSAVVRFSKINKAKAVLSLLFLSIIMVWMSWGILALTAYLFSKEPYFELFTIDSLEPGGRKGWDVDLLDRKTKVKYSVVLSRQYMHESFPWKEEDVVCAKGRTSFFGAIIEDFNAGECELEGFRLEKQEINGVRLD